MTTLDTIQADELRTLYHRLLTLRRHAQAAADTAYAHDQGTIVQIEEARITLIEDLLDEIDWTDVSQ